MKTGYAIELLFDNNFENYVCSLWDDCAKHNYSDHMTQIEGDVIPHIALSVYEDITDDDIIPLFNRYKNVKENKASFNSSAVCMFKQTLVTYLNVNVNRDMLNYFENVYHFFIELSSKCSAYYLPYTIIPHISIAKSDSIGDAKECFGFIADRFEPQQLIVEKIALFKLYFDDNHKLIKCQKMDEKDLV